jgi:tetratricopeptide (TPR) repeat protein
MVEVTSDPFELSFVHDPAPLTAAVELIASGARGRPLILAGAPASGRRHVLEWLRRRASERGQPVRVVPLSLDGFEPTGPALTAFLELQLACGPAPLAPVEDELRKLLKVVSAQPAAATSGRWAVAFAVLLLVPEPQPLLASLLADGAPPLTPELVLSRALALHAGDGRVILHMPSESTISDPTMAWLLARCGEEAKVTPAFSCARELASEALVGPPRPDCNPLRIDVGAPLTREQAQQRYGQSLSDEVWQASRAEPARLRRALQLTAAGSPRAAIDAWLEAQGEAAAPLARLLTLAAVCGELVPILPLLAAGGVSQADAERYIDRIDDGLCGDEATLPLFDDLAYRHPGFPGLAVYRFRDRALRAALLDRGDPDELTAQAKALFEFLSTRLVVATRSIAQLFLHLTERVQFQLSAGPRQRLRLWVGEAEVPLLEQMLRFEVNSGRLSSDALFMTAQRDQSLPVLQRLALLEASITDEAQLPRERRIACSALRTDLLCASGRFPLALASADAGLQLLDSEGPEPEGVRGLLYFLRANCQRQMGEVEAATESFMRAATEAAKPKPDGSIDFHNQGVCLAEAGHCHAQRGQWEPAVALLTQGIAQLRKVPEAGRVHPEQIAQLEKNLAVCEAKRREAAAPPA